MVFVTLITTGSSQTLQLLIFSSWNVDHDNTDIRLKSLTWFEGAVGLKHLHNIGYFLTPWGCGHSVGGMISPFYCPSTHQLISPLEPAYPLGGELTLGLNPPQASGWWPAHRWPRYCFPLGKYVRTNAYCLANVDSIYICCSVYCIHQHTWYLSFFLHWQNFWRIKFTPKNA